MKKKKWLFIVPPAIVILGCIGYTQEKEANESSYSVFLKSLNLLKVSFDGATSNPYIEIARWLGVFFFFALIYVAFTSLFERSMVFYKASFLDSVSIHGDSVYSDVLASAIGKMAIRSSKAAALRAPVQVIMFDDDKKALEFYQKNTEVLSRAREVHLCLKMGTHISGLSDNVFITNLPELRVLDYWRKHYLTLPEKVVIIGSGPLAESVLHWGLLTNVFNVRCHNRYTVIGNFKKYLALHPDLPEMIRKYGDDEIEFEDGQWYSYIDIIRDADRIILCNATDVNIEIGSALAEAGIRRPIHMFAENESISSLLDKALTPVGVLGSENIKDMILMDSVHLAGKLCHATYMVLEENEDAEVPSDAAHKLIFTQKFRDSWTPLDAFTKGSNYAAAIHDPVKFSLMKREGVDVRGMNSSQNADSYDALPVSVRHRLQEIEQIRWCRYHFLHYWKAPEGDIIIDGKKENKDKENRLHVDLVPYIQLPEHEKEKDAYFYQTLSLRVPESTDARPM